MRRVLFGNIAWLAFFAIVLTACSIDTPRFRSPTFFALLGVNIPRPLRFGRCAPSPLLGSPPLDSVAKLLRSTGCSFSLSTVTAGHARALSVSAGAAPSAHRSFRRELFLHASRPGREWAGFTLGRHELLRHGAARSAEHGAVRSAETGLVRWSAATPPRALAASVFLVSFAWVRSQQASKPQDFAEEILPFSFHKFKLMGWNQESKTETDPKPFQSTSKRDSQNRALPPSPLCADPHTWERTWNRTDHAQGCHAHRILNKSQMLTILR